MTNADRIRKMTDDELVDLLVWRRVSMMESVPECDCEDFASGCALTCPHEKMERNVRKWLGKEYGT